jgi:hypothetical protein
MTRAIYDRSEKTLDRAALARQIELLVHRLRPDVTVERRHDERFAMPVLLQLTPLDDDGQPLAGMSTIVVGKDISRRGMSFFHERPLPYRRAIIALEHPETGVFAAEIDINWCQFTRPGWYVSGGRLLRVVEPERVPRSSEWPRLMSSTLETAASALLAK